MDFSVQASDIQEIGAKLSSNVLLDRNEALDKSVILDSRNVDASSLFPLTIKVPSLSPMGVHRNTRFVNILAENSFDAVKSSQAEYIDFLLKNFENQDPIIRGFAVKSAGKVANEETVERLVPIIIRGSSNTDPYVRKAASLAILSLHQTKASFIDRFKLSPVLKQLVEDSNPNVAANAVSTLSEINETRSTPLFLPTTVSVNNLLAAIDQATEWGQVQILDFVCSYQPSNAADARGIISRVSSRLSHANSAVVLSAIRCCLQMNLFVEDQQKIRETLTKVVLPLVTLLNNSAPIQYIALKSILVLLRHYKRMLSSEVTIFFCKFDDPLYMKLAKLDVILTLVTTQNVGKVLEELFDYAQQADVEFVRRSISSIGQLAVLFESAAASCVDKIVALVESKIHFVVQECIVVAVDIFRRYPESYLAIIPKICLSLNGNLDDHRAKAAMVWILGHYASRIGNAGELIDNFFIDDFIEDTPDVQLSILTATLKYYLSNPEEGEDLLRVVFDMATNQVENPDIRDRAYQYIEMVSKFPELVRAIVQPEDETAMKPSLVSYDPELVESLIPLIGTLSVLYMKLPADFVETTHIISLGNAESIESGNTGETAVDKMNMPVLVPSNSEFQIEIKGVLHHIGEQTMLALRITNFSESPLEVQDIRFNRNVFGFAPGTIPSLPPIKSNKSVTVSVPVVFSQDLTVGAKPSSNFDVAIKINRPKSIFFVIQTPLDVVLVAEDSANVNKDFFQRLWDSLSQDLERDSTVENARIDNLDVAKNILKQNKLYYIARRQRSGYFIGRTMKGEAIIVYLTFNDGAQVEIGVKMNQIELAPVLLQLIHQLVQ